MSNFSLNIKELRAIRNNKWFLSFLTPKYIKILLEKLYNEVCNLLKLEREYFKLKNKNEELTNENKKLKINFDYQLERANNLEKQLEITTKGFERLILKKEEEFNNSKIEYVKKLKELKDSLDKFEHENNLKKTIVSEQEFIISGQQDLNDLFYKNFLELSKWINSYIENLKRLGYDVEGDLSGPNS